MAVYDSIKMKGLPRQFNKKNLLMNPMHQAMLYHQQVERKRRQNIRYKDQRIVEHIRYVVNHYENAVKSRLMKFFCLMRTLGTDSSWK